MRRDNVTGLKRASWIIPQDMMARCIEYTLNFKPLDDTQKRDKKILEYVFLNGYTATYIHDLKDPCIVCYSNRNKGKPLSACSILRVVYQHIPELKDRKRVYVPKHEEKRKELGRRKREGSVLRDKRCAFCGCVENLELHHMIPICMGGDNSDLNLVYLCKKCHKQVTKYQNGILKMEE